MMSYAAHSQMLQCTFCKKLCLLGTSRCFFSMSSPSHYKVEKRGATAIVCLHGQILAGTHRDPHPDSNGREVNSKYYFLLHNQKAFVLARCDKRFDCCTLLASKSINCPTGPTLGSFLWPCPVRKEWTQVGGWVTCCGQCIRWRSPPSHSHCSADIEKEAVRSAEN